MVAAFALAEHCHVAVKLVASIGGMGALGAFGGVGNVFSVIAFEFSKLFSMGDIIKVSLVDIGV